MLEVLLDNARFAQERAVEAEAHARISYGALVEVMGEPLRCLARFLLWAAIPEVGERWVCEHGTTQTVAKVHPKEDGSAVVWVWREPAWRPAR